MSLPYDSPRRRSRRLALIRVVIVLTLATGANYLGWRWLESVNWSAWPIAVPLILAETYSFLDAVLFCTTMWRMRERGPAPEPPEDATVDIFITTYNEPVDLVMETALAAKNIRWPHETWVLDDGAREEMREAAEAAGIGYLTRSEDWKDRPRHAKAGNLNNALFMTSGEFLMILDADQIPSPDILHKTLGWFRDPQVALVQTPQWFHNVDEDDLLGSQAPLFYGPIQQGKDGWNAAFFCGSNAVLRREALMQLGLVGYVREVEQAVKDALRTADSILSSARRSPEAKASPATVAAIDRVREAAATARRELAGKPTGSSRAGAPDAGLPERPEPSPVAGRRSLLRGMADHWLGAALVAGIVVHEGGVVTALQLWSGAGGRPLDNLVVSLVLAVALGLGYAALRAVLQDRKRTRDGAAKPTSLPASRVGLPDSLDHAARNGAAEAARDQPRDLRPTVAEVTYRFQQEADAAARSVVEADIEALRADLAALGELPVQADSEVAGVVVSDEALARLADREWSPLGALQSVHTLIEAVDIDRPDEAQAVMPMATISVTEDMATAMRLHALGWKTVYHHEVLARGLAPEDMGSMLHQRLRWAQGTLQVMLRENPLVQRGLTAGQRLMYFGTMWSYLAGFAAIVYIAAPITYFVLGILPVTTLGSDFMVRLIPFLIANQILFTVIGWRVKTWRGQQYSLALFPLWIRACTTAVANVWFGRSLGFVVTPKTKSGGDSAVPWGLVRPQLIAMALLVAAGVLGLIRWAQGELDALPTFVNLVWIAYDLVVLSVVVRAVRYRGYQGPLKRLPGESGTAQNADI